MKLSVAGSFTSVEHNRTTCLQSTLVWTRLIDSFGFVYALSRSVPSLPTSVDLTDKGWPVMMHWSCNQCLNVSRLKLLGNRAPNLRKSASLSSSCWPSKDDVEDDGDGGGDGDSVETSGGDEEEIEGCGDGEWLSEEDPGRSCFCYSSGYLR